MKKDTNVTLVYSTDMGRITPEKEIEKTPVSDGVVRIHRDSKGRKGKGVSIVKGLGLNNKELKLLAKNLKKQCGCGGTVKEFDIEVQTDNREQIKTILEKLNYQLKLAGS